MPFPCHHSFNSCHIFTYSCPYKHTCTAKGIRHYKTRQDIHLYPSTSTFAHSYQHHAIPTILIHCQSYRQMQIWVWLQMYKQTITGEEFLEPPTKNWRKKNKNKRLSKKYIHIKNLGKKQNEEAKQQLNVRNLMIFIFVLNNLSNKQWNAMNSETTCRCFRWWRWLLWNVLWYKEVGWQKWVER